MNTMGEEKIDKMDSLSLIVQASGIRGRGRQGWEKEKKQKKEVNDHPQIIPHPEAQGLQSFYPIN